MHIPPPQPVANLTDPAGTIHAVRLLAEARPQGDPRVYLRETHRLPPGVCRKAGDLYLHRQRPIVAAIVALAEAFGALELELRSGAGPEAQLPAIRAMCAQRVPEAGDEQIRLAAMWFYAMSPAAWRDALPPTATDSDTFTPEHAQRRPDTGYGMQPRWPAS